MVCLKRSSICFTFYCGARCQTHRFPGLGATVTHISCQLDSAETAQTNLLRSAGGIHPPSMPWQTHSNESSESCSNAGAPGVLVELLHQIGNSVLRTKPFPSLSQVFNPQAVPVTLLELRI